MEKWTNTQWELQGHCQGVQRRSQKCKSSAWIEIGKRCQKNQEGFFKYVNNNQNHKENISPMLKRRPRKADVLNSLYFCLLSPWPWEQKSRSMKTQSHCQWRKSCVWMIVQTWPLKTDETWHYVLKGVKGAGWHNRQATLHDLWEVMEVRGHPRRIEG